MNVKALTEHRYFRSAIGAMLGSFCGWLLLAAPFGQSWVDASYDSLFRFSSRQVTNKVVVVRIDEAAAQALETTREQWDRNLHAQLLERLTKDGCPLVVFDVVFKLERDAPTDTKLAEAMARHGRVVLAASYVRVNSPEMEAGQVIAPHARFLAAATNWGIAKLDTNTAPARKHWPFPAPVEGRPSLPWTAARLYGTKLSNQPQEQWIRYYGERGGLDLMSFHIARARVPGFFRDKVVFIGGRPEDDPFQTPYGDVVGGVEILATEFLNLVNHDWLRRMPGWVEFTLLALSGGVMGGALSRFRRLAALGIAGGTALAFIIAAVGLSYFSNFWFPWLIIVGGQIPCALAWAMIPARVQPMAISITEKVDVEKTTMVNGAAEPLPDAPEYELLTPHIGKGGFGKVWIARSAIGQWQALKAVYASNFGEKRGPYEAEFQGLQRYKPVSEKHPGLLRVELISRMKPEGYFYYLMELADAQAPGWEKQPHLYKPKDLEYFRRQAYGRRLPVPECLRIGTVLADALNFLHEQGLIHRDIKPSNVIFVKERPKLADIGLVADIRPVEDVKTMVGTPGYMPPPPEKPGTVQADIYALGMVLYVISTGGDPQLFPDLSTTLMERSGYAEFMRLNPIILKACHPDLTQRYQKTADMLRDLQEAATG